MTRALLVFALLAASICATAAGAQAPPPPPMCNPFGPACTPVVNGLSDAPSRPHVSAALGSISDLTSVSTAVSIVHTPEWTDLNGHDPGITDERVYGLDREGGSIVFGDGESGRRPPAGDAPGVVSVIVLPRIDELDPPSAEELTGDDRLDVFTGVEKRKVRGAPTSTGILVAYHLDAHDLRDTAAGVLPVRRVTLTLDETSEARLAEKMGALRFTKAPRVTLRLRKNGAPVLRIKARGVTETGAKLRYSAKLWGDPHVD